MDIRTVYKKAQHINMKQDAIMHAALEKRQKKGGPMSLLFLSRI